jgi:hypothetical protein
VVSSSYPRSENRHEKTFEEKVMKTLEPPIKEGVKLKKVEHMFRGHGLTMIWGL